MTIDTQKREIMEAVAGRIKYFRHRKNLSQEDLALRAGINPAYFGQVERGLKCPTIDTLYKIAKALEISPPELLRTDSLPSYVTDYEGRVKELLSRVPPNQVEKVLNVVEGIVDLFQ